MTLFSLLRFKKSLINTVTKLTSELNYEKNRNESYQKDLIILLDTNLELRRKIKDLENNIEFLTNKVPELAKGNIEKAGKPKKTTKKKTTTTKKTTKKEVISSDQTTK